MQVFRIAMPTVFRRMPERAPRLWRRSLAANCQTTSSVAAGTCSPGKWRHASSIWTIMSMVLASSTHVSLVFLAFSRIYSILGEFSGCVKELQFPNVRHKTSFTTWLLYVFAASETQTIPTYSFAEIIQRSLCRDQQTQAWCPRCSNYQPHVSNSALL